MRLVAYHVIHQHIFRSFCYTNVYIIIGILRILFKYHFNHILAEDYMIIDLYCHDITSEVKIRCKLLSNFKDHPRMVCHVNIPALHEQYFE
jgi:hypothetical protein